VKCELILKRIAWEKVGSEVQTEFGSYGPSFNFRLFGADSIILSYLELLLLETAMSENDFSTSFFFREVGDVLPLWLDDEIGGAIV
jgi:hypothetical protein